MCCKQHKQVFCYLKFKKEGVLLLPFYLNRFKMLKYIYL